MKINIVHVCSSASWGGMEMVVGRLAYLQKTNGYKVKVVTGKDTPLSARCRELGLDNQPILADGSLGWSGCCRFLKFVKETEPDVVHVHYSKDLNLAVPVKQLTGGKIVFTKHLGSYINKKDPWHRFVYRGVDRATAISRLIKDNLIETTPLPEGKVDVVYLGTDTSRFIPDLIQREAVRDELEISNDAILIGMMGRISYGKGYEDFIQMAQALSGRNVEFLFIGGHSRNEDRYGDEIEQEIRDKLGPRAHLTGFKDDRERYLQALDMFVFPSYAESFGLALTEAMACGLPCVAYGKDGVLDIIEDRKDGLLAEVRKVKDLIQKTSVLLDDEGLRIKLGKAGREKVIKEFSDPQMLQGFERAYKIALGAQ
ncbi:MAG: glycosyltransferase family 4 protein [Candidatus Edwardsbacteria bacterium]|nr:glycosyltransferase family 4 protein [Candidatus Edwardsbacteria bacterium]